MTENEESNLELNVRIKILPLLISDWMAFFEWPEFSEPQFP